jgi:membrane protein DedA with SNARE-associated domain
MVVFISLLLAGLNLPFSEDLLIISSAIIAQTDRDLIVPLYTAIYLGVVISDNIAYWLGTRIGKGLFKSKFFCRVLTRDKLNRMHAYLDRYGIFTFIVCRFIPFGVRNTLFMGSGITNFNYKLFLIYDSIAAAISTGTLFYLFYRLGASIEKPFKFVGVVLFVLLIVIGSIVIARLYVKWKKGHFMKKEDLQGCSPD